MRASPQADHAYFTFGYFFWLGQVGLHEAQALVPEPKSFRIVICFFFLLR